MSNPPDDLDAAAERLLDEVLAGPADEFPRRYRRCWFGDNLTHAARPEGITNSKTACGRWVGDKRIDDQEKKGRFTPVTCPACLTALADQGTL